KDIPIIRFSKRSVFRDLIDVSSWPSNKPVIPSLVTIYLNCLFSCGSLYIIIIVLQADPFFSSINIEPVVFQKTYQRDVFFFGKVYRQTGRRPDCRNNRDTCPDGLLDQFKTYAATEHQKAF